MESMTTNVNDMGTHVMMLSEWGFPRALGLPNPWDFSMTLGLPSVVWDFSTTLGDPNVICVVPSNIFMSWPWCDPCAVTCAQLGYVFSLNFWFWF
jgi:hypothetical protein